MSFLKIAQDKGQKAMLTAWLESIKAGREYIDYSFFMANSLATILAIESLSTGVVMKVDLSILNND